MTIYWSLTAKCGLRVKITLRSTHVYVHPLFLLLSPTLSFSLSAPSLSSLPSPPLPCLLSLHSLSFSSPPPPPQLSIFILKPQERRRINPIGQGFMEVIVCATSLSHPELVVFK